MVVEVKEAKYLQEFKIQVTFSDDKVKIVDLKGKLKGPVFEPLLNIEYFRNFRIHFNTIEWPNGADIAPEFLYKIGIDQYTDRSLVAEE